MKFTQEQLELMTNFELNVAAASFFYKCNNLMITEGERGNVEVYCDDAKVDGDYKPCNSWKDCGELIEELNITTSTGSLFSCAAFVTEKRELIQAIAAISDVKRAVTIVYVLAKQRLNNE